MNDFSGIASSFSPFSLMLTTGLLYITFITFRYGRWLPDISKTFIMNVCWILSNASQHLMRWSCHFCLWVCLYSGIHWWISVYWTIPASLGWSLLDHDGWSFWCVLGFCLQEFYWVILHWYSYGKLVWCSLSLFCLCVV